MKIINLGCCLLAATTIATYSSARADEHSDNLAKCLVNATTPADQVVFMKWMFATLALHPAVSSMANISDKEREDANRETGALFTAMLAEKCPSQVRDVVMFDGPQAIESAFEVFGRSAMMGLMANDKVAAGLQDFSKYIDEKKLQQVMAGVQPNSPSH